MSTWEESTTWIAVGVSALAAVLLVTTLVLGARLRTARRGEPEPGSDVVEITSALERAREGTAQAQLESQRAHEEAERTQAEVRWLRHLGEIGATVDLEKILSRALESATRVANAAAAMIVLTRGSDEPVIATFGLSADESSRELLGLTPEGGEARAVKLTYRYSGDEEDYDEFRLRGGLAIPVSDERGDRAGTLAIFWRRLEHEMSDEELVRLEGLAGALAPAVVNAFRFEEARRLADLDPVTGLHSRRFLHEALVRECARARRYERRLALVFLSLDARITTALLAAAGERLRSAVRGADLVCHLENGRFAVLLPEAALADAERTYRRLQFAVGANLGGLGRIGLPAGIVELRPEDDPLSFLERAEAALAREEGGVAGQAAVEPGA